MSNLIENHNIKPVPAKVAHHLWSYLGGLQKELQKINDDMSSLQGIPQTERAAMIQRISQLVRCTIPEERNLFNVSLNSAVTRKDRRAENACCISVIFPVLSVPQQRSPISQSDIWDKHFGGERGYGDLRNQFLDALFTKDKEEKKETVFCRILSHHNARKRGAGIRGV